MAIPATGSWSRTNFKNMLHTGTLAWGNITTEAWKAALFNNTLTPLPDTETAWNVAPYNANEVGTPSGGVSLTGMTFLNSSGYLTWDCNDPAWAQQTISAIRGVLFYTSTPATKYMSVLSSLGTDFNVANGIFTVNIDALGVWRLQLP
jgi:hypothetical protein